MNLFENYKAPTLDDYREEEWLCARRDAEVCGNSGKVISVKAGDEARYVTHTEGEELIVIDSDIVWSRKTNTPEEGVSLWRKGGGVIPNIVPGQVWFDGKSMLYVYELVSIDVSIILPDNNSYLMTTASLKQQGELLTPSTGLSKKATHKCNCETRQLLITGCQCGGI